MTCTRPISAQIIQRVPRRIRRACSWGTFRGERCRCQPTPIGRRMPGIRVLPAIEAVSCTHGCGGNPGTGTPVHPVTVARSLTETAMNEILSEEGMDLLFRAARTHNAWLDRPVSDDTLRQLYDLMKWGPTSANASPARVLFLRTRQAKAKLLPALSPGNIAKTQSAPVTA